MKNLIYLIVLIIFALNCSAQKCESLCFDTITNAPKNQLMRSIFVNNDTLFYNTGQTIIIGFWFCELNPSGTDHEVNIQLQNYYLHDTLWSDGDGHDLSWDTIHTSTGTSPFVTVTIPNDFPEGLAYIVPSWDVADFPGPDSTAVFIKNINAGINEFSNHLRPKEVHYYNFLGIEIPKPDQGVFIERTLYTDGEMLTRKIAIINN